MLKPKYPSEQQRGMCIKRGCTTAIFFFAACSFSLVAASFPTAPGNQEGEVLHRVQTCFKRGPYADEEEARTVAANAREKGYVASVTRDTKGWTVRICKKESESSN
jgi:hypothetical protein